MHIKNVISFYLLRCNNISLDICKIEKKIKLNENNLVAIEPLNWVSVRFKKIKFYV